MILMDDDKIIPQENQPNNTEPIYETVPVETLTVEEAPQDLTTPEVESLPSPVDGPPPIYEENKNQYMFIIGGAVVFLIILVIIFRAIFSGKTTSKPINLIYWCLLEDK